MKRIYIAIIFLSIALGLCIFEQIFINHFYDEAIALTEQAISCADDEDYDKAYKICKKLNDSWQKKYPYLTSMVEHGVVDEAGNLIGALPDLAKTKNDDLRTQLVNVKNQLKTIRDVEKIKFENIF